MVSGFMMLDDGWKIHGVAAVRTCDIGVQRMSKNDFFCFSVVLYMGVPES